MTRGTDVSGVTQCLSSHADSVMVPSVQSISSLLTAVLLAKNLRVIDRMERYVLFVKDIRTGDAQLLTLHSSWLTSDCIRRAYRKGVPSAFKKLISRCACAKNWWPEKYQAMVQAGRTPVAWFTVPTYKGDGTNEMEHVRCVLMDKIVFTYFRDYMGIPVEGIPAIASVQRRCV